MAKISPQLQETVVEEVTCCVDMIDIYINNSLESLKLILWEVLRRIQAEEQR